MIFTATVRVIWVSAPHPMVQRTSTRSTTNCKDWCWVKSHRYIRCSARPKVLKAAKRAAFVFNGCLESTPRKQRSLRRPLAHTRFQVDEKLVQLLELLA